jgi:Domain of unknown function (DUF6504)
MRRYDDPVEVRQGWIGAPEAGVEGPDQFLWRGRLWQVRAVLAHWVETGPWWHSAGVRAVLGSDEPSREPSREPARERVPEGRPAPLLGQDLLVERELWRVEAGRGRPTSRPTPENASESPPGSPGQAGAGGPAEGWSGVFDLSFSWADGQWQLVGCAD